MIAESWQILKDVIIVKYPIISLYIIKYWEYTYS